MTENLINRISFYLASGGLFNPELADHIAVRTLLFECREALAQHTWVVLTDEEIEQMGLSNYIKVVRETEAKLKDKNT
jgi:IS5 family transposase